MFRAIVRPAERILEAVRTSFAPRKDATSREIRLNGLICLCAALGAMAVVGLLIWISSLVLPSNARVSPEVVLVPALAFYVLTRFGGYRLLVGKSPEPAGPGEVSPKRILFGIASVLMVFALVLGIAVIAQWVAG